jgi:hypothetical protein
MIALVTPRQRPDQSNTARKARAYGCNASQEITPMLRRLAGVTHQRLVEVPHGRNRIGNGGEGQTISSTPKACGVVFVIRAEGA